MSVCGGRAKARAHYRSPAGAGGLTCARRRRPLMLVHRAGAPAAGPVAADGAGARARRPRSPARSPPRRRSPATRRRVPHWARCRRFSGGRGDLAGPAPRAPTRRRGRSLRSAWASPRLTEGGAPQPGPARRGGGPAGRDRRRCGGGSAGARVPGPCRASECPMVLVAGAGVPSRVSDGARGAHPRGGRASRCARRRRSASRRRRSHGPPVARHRRPRRASAALPGLAACTELNSWLAAPRWSQDCTRGGSPLIASTAGAAQAALLEQGGSVQPGRAVRRAGRGPRARGRRPEAAAAGRRRGAGGARAVRRPRGLRAAT